MALKVTKLLLALAVCQILMIHVKAETHSVREHQKIVLDYVEAFNQRKTELMLQHTTEQVVWMSVTGEKISVETKGKKALQKALLSYFKSVPSIHSKILNIELSGPFVYTTEKAHWSSDGEIKSQCSPAIYQFKSDKISHVWYFESYSC